MLAVLRKLRCHAVDGEGGNEVVCWPICGRCVCVAMQRPTAHLLYCVGLLTRRRGGIEPLHISVSLELKSSPSTNLTNPGSRGTGEPHRSMPGCHWS